MSYVFLYERTTPLLHGLKRVRYAVDHFLTKEECPVLGVNGGLNFINRYASVAEFMEVKGYEMQGFNAVTKFGGDIWTCIIDGLYCVAGVNTKQYLFGIWVED